MSGRPSLSDLTRFGRVIFRRPRNRVARAAPDPAVRGGGGIPRDDGVERLAAFYAWQMAASRIESVH